MTKELLKAKKLLKEVESKKIKTLNDIDFMKGLKDSIESSERAIRVSKLQKKKRR